MAVLGVFDLSLAGESGWGWTYMIIGPKWLRTEAGGD
jgi:hypothetical protein